MVLVIMSLTKIFSLQRFIEVTTTFSLQQCDFFQPQEVNLTFEKEGGYIKSFSMNKRIFFEREQSNVDYLLFQKNIRFIFSIAFSTSLFYR